MLAPSLMPALYFLTSSIRPMDTTFGAAGRIRTSRSKFQAILQMNTWRGRAAASGSAKYGIAYFGGDPEPALTLPAGYMPVSMQVTNTAYTGSVIQNGNAFSRKFGDNPATPGVVETNHPDYFKLKIGGSDAAGQPVGSPIEVYLADYRFANDAQDFVLREWLPVNLSGLRGAATLTFDLETTDVGQFGANTPFYFALDNLVLEPIPEPATVVLCIVSMAGMLVLRRSRMFMRSSDST